MVSPTDRWPDSDPVDAGTDDAHRIDAGEFGAWLDGVRDSLHDGTGVDVPCGTCTACCRSSQFVHIGPDESDVLAHVPGELVFPAPGLPSGHVLMGYDEQGRCPMLVDDACSIYDHRPRTCRTYDCRVLAAAGVDLADEPDKRAIDDRAGRWSFTHRSSDDQQLHEAVRAAATHLHEHTAQLPRRIAPASATQRAVLAIEIHEMFVDRTPDPSEVRVTLERRRPARPAGSAQSVDERRAR